MIGATAAPLADGLNPMGDYTKMDKALRDSLSSSSEDDIVPVIFQLNSEVLDEDSTSEGFFSALGNLFAEHGIIMTMFSIIILLSAAGIGYVIRSSKEANDEKNFDVSIEAELIDED